jgi:hypothetical protein
MNIINLIKQLYIEYKASNAVPYIAFHPELGVPIGIFNTKDEPDYASRVRSIKRMGINGNINSYTKAILLGIIYPIPSFTSPLGDLGDFHQVQLNPGGSYQFMIGPGGTDLGFLGGTSYPFGLYVGQDSVLHGDLAVGIDTDSEINCTGDVIAFSTSDIKLKSNVIPISNPTSKILQLSGNTFTWNKKAGIKKAGKNDVGIIAQEVKKVLPNIVRESENNILSVRYEKLIPLLIEGIKEQQNTIENLKERIKKLENK